MNVADFPSEYGSNVSEAVEKQFQEHYLRPLGDHVRYVRLESKFGVLYQGYVLIFFKELHMKHSHCGELIEKTAAALNEDAIDLLLLAVQKDNLELSVKTALNR
jgi:hypothetical protein